MLLGVAFIGGARLHAQGAAIQVSCPCGASAFTSEVVTRHHHIGEAELQFYIGIPAHGPASCLDDDVDLTRLDARPALRPTDRLNCQVLLVAAKDRSRKRPAHIDVNTLPAAFVIHLCVAGKGAVMSGTR
ncbi:hypothetical protein D9M70_543820 [compost metagenome]